MTTVNQNESQQPLAVLPDARALGSWLQRDSNCSLEIDRGVRKIESPDIREIVGVVFGDFLLHQFRCYVETLLAQVRMRAGLANVSPLRSAIDKFSSPITSTPVRHVSAADAGLENPLWEELAVAV
ncbi:MAG TPA: hypothetical protein VIW64_16475 [Pyrinomonadaceae bacterium]